MSIISYATFSCRSLYVVILRRPTTTTTVYVLFILMEAASVCSLPTLHACVFILFLRA